MKEAHYLNESVTLADHNYALIDRLFYNDIDKDFPVLQIIQPLLEAQAHLYPYLLPLDELNLESWSKLSKLINRQTASSEPPLCAVFFNSNLLPDELCSRLADYLIKKINERNYILRYYDPKILVQLFRMLNPDELSDFLDITSSNLWTIYLNERWNSIVFQEKIDGDSNFNDNKTINFDDIGIVNRVLSTLPKAKSLIEYVEISGKIATSLDNAKREYQIHSNSDRELFATHCMSIHERFYISPTMSNLLASAIRDKTNYTDIVNNITESQWDIIKYECEKLDKESV